MKFQKTKEVGYICNRTMKFLFNLKQAPKISLIVEKKYEIKENYILLLIFLIFCNIFIEYYQELKKQKIIHKR